MPKKKMDIIYEDKDYLVINKPAHLLTIGTIKEKDRTLYHEAREYLKKKNPKNKIFIVHRLDKDTSGIVVFVKNEELKNTLQNNWDKYAIKRNYIALVDGSIEKNKDHVVLKLEENKQYQVFVSDKGKQAITNYEVINKNKYYSYLNISIETGRKNQIRATMSHLGHPICGDKKYGSTNKAFRRLALHANELVLINPKTKKEMVFNSTIPKLFNDVKF